jgi:hypothetical protein
MKLSLSAVLVLSVQIVLAQGWKVSSGESDFDGKYKTASCLGIGGSRPYTSAQLVINSFNDDKINFYLTNFGFAGCDDNTVTFLFDKQRLYEASFNVNDENDAFFFNLFWRDGEELTFMDQIFKEMTLSNRLSIRVKNDCFVRDYVFDLNGARGAIDKVVGLKNIDARIFLIQEIKKTSQLEDSMFSYLDLKINEEIEPSEFFDIHRYLRDPYKGKFYKIDLDKFRILFEILYAYIVDESVSHFESKDGQLVGFYGLPEKEIEVGVVLNLLGDEIQIKFSDSQLYIDSILRVYEGRESGDYYRLLRRVNFSVPKEYLDRLNYNVLFELYNRSYNYVSYNTLSINKYIFHQDNDNIDAIFKIVDPNGDVVREWRYPYFFEPEKDRVLRISNEIEKAKKAEEARIILLNTPDLSQSPFSFVNVEIKPRPSGCNDRPEEICIRDLIIAQLDNLFIGSKRSKYRNFRAIIIVDHLGKITLSDVDGISTKNSYVLQGIFNELPPLVVPRKFGKVCSVQVELFFP